jgi:hypothetical protein
VGVASVPDCIISGVVLVVATIGDVVASSSSSSCSATSTLPAPTSSCGDDG